MGTRGLVVFSVGDISSHRCKSQVFITLKLSRSLKYGQYSKARKMLKFTFYAHIICRAVLLIAELAHTLS